MEGVFVCLKDTVLSHGTWWKTKWGGSEQEMISLFSRQHSDEILPACTGSRWDAITLQGGLLAARGAGCPWTSALPICSSHKVLHSSLLLIGPHGANQGTGMPKHVHPIKGTAAQAAIVPVGSMTLHPWSPAQAVCRSSVLHCTPLFTHPSPSPSACLS